MNVDAPCLPDYVRQVAQVLSRNYDTYLVGGAVRDQLFGHTPRDFDLFCLAPSWAVHRDLPSSQVVGGRYPAVWLHGAGNDIEISCAECDEATLTDPAAILAKDAGERDFTINAIYYSFRLQRYADPVNGLADAASCSLVPVASLTRCAEIDPLRLLRGLRFAARFGLSVPDALSSLVRQHRHAFGNGQRHRVEREIGKWMAQLAPRQFATLILEYGLLPLFGRYDDGETALIQRAAGLDNLLSSRRAWPIVLLGARLWSRTLGQIADPVALLGHIEDILDDSASHLWSSMVRASELRRLSNRWIRSRQFDLHDFDAFIRRLLVCALSHS